MAYMFYKNFMLVIPQVQTHGYGVIVIQIVIQK